MSPEQKADPTPRQLYRSTHNRVIAGVAGGLGEFLNLDPTLIRLGFILLTVFGGSGFLIYILMWLLIPATGSDIHLTKEHIEQNAQEIKSQAQKVIGSVQDQTSATNSAKTVALFFIFLGILFLLNNFHLVRWLSMEKLWPLILIGFGILLLRRR